jgi:hypothetical protein
VVALVLVGGACITASASVARNGNGTGALRCGFTQSPYGRLGIYITLGDTSCRTGEFLIHRSFYTAGTPTKFGDMERYPDGWICGGQMGTYSCDKPSPSHPTKAVLGLACRGVGDGVGCPRVEPYPAS